MRAAAVEHLVYDAAVALYAEGSAGIGVRDGAVPAVAVVDAAVEGEDVAAARNPVGVLEGAVGAVHAEGHRVARLEGREDLAEPGGGARREDEIVLANGHGTALAAHLGHDKLQLAAEAYVLAAADLEADKPALPARAGRDGGEVFAEDPGVVVSAGLVEVLRRVFKAALLVRERYFDLGPVAHMRAAVREADGAVPLGRGLVHAVLDDHAGGHARALAEVGVDGPDDVVAQVLRVGEHLR